MSAHLKSYVTKALLWQPDRRAGGADKMPLLTAVLPLRLNSDLTRRRDGARIKVSALTMCDYSVSPAIGRRLSARSTGAVPAQAGRAPA